MLFNYVIATYSGFLPNRDEKEQEVLQIHLQNLYDILSHDDRKNKDTFQITIVCPTPKTSEYKNYYQREKWEEKFSSLNNVKLVYLPYIGKNDHHSYDQWLQGYTNFPDFDYYFFIEDDYTVNTEFINFDIDLVNLYKKFFFDNVGYLCARACKNEHRYHASVSNGLISGDTLRRFNKDTIIEELYNFPVKGSIPWPQLKFSFLFSDNGIPVKDYTLFYSTPFWDSYYKNIKMYGNEKLPAILIPIQKILYGL